jgi:uncharacterized membrane protein YkvA (DUF1232 family)
MARTTTDRAPATGATAPRGERRVLGLKLRGRRASAFTLLRHPVALIRFLTARGTPLAPRLLAVAALAYVLFPLDLIPDVIPVVGWLDDIGITALLLGYVASQAARYANRAIEAPAAAPLPA